MKQEYLDKCKELASNSNCKFVHFGAFITDAYGQIIGEGWNEAMLPELCCLKDKLDRKTVGRNPGVCTAMHAEQMAIAEALMTCSGDDYNLQPRNSMKEFTLYVAGWYPGGTPFSKGENSFACTLCTRWIKFVGLGKVVTVKREYTPDEALDGAVEDILEKIHK